MITVLVAVLLVIVAVYISLGLLLWALETAGVWRNDPKRFLRSFSTSEAWMVLFEDLAWGGIAVICCFILPFVFNPDFD